MFDPKEIAELWDIIGGMCDICLFPLLGCLIAILSALYSMLPSEKVVSVLVGDKKPHIGDETI